MYRRLDLIDIHDRIKAGDQDAEVELYCWLQDHRGIICGSRINRSEDIATYVWMHLVRFIRNGEVREPKAIISLAEVIAYRHRKQQDRKDSRYVEFCIDIAKADNAPSAIEVIYQRERRRNVNTAIDRLEPRKKEVIHRYLNGQSLEEIAAGMQLTDTQVRLAKNRAIEAIRKFIKVKHSTRPYHRKDNDNNDNPHD